MTRVKPVSFERLAGGRRTVFEGLVIGAIIVSALHYGQSILIPLTLALFLTFLLSPGVTALRRRGLPRAFAVSIVSFVALSVVVIMLIVVGRQLTILVEELPKYQSTLSAKIKSLKEIAGTGGSNTVTGRALEALQELQGDIVGRAKPSSSSGDKRPPAAGLDRQSTQPTGEPVPVSIVEAPATAFDQFLPVAAFVAGPAATTGIVIIFVLLVLYAREDVRDRAIRLFGTNDLERTTKAFDDAGTRLNSYFVATFGINTAFGIVIGVGLWLIGVPNPILWGVFAIFARFIPFVGPAVAGAVPLFLAIAIDPGWWMAGLTLALFVLAEIIFSQVVETIVQGESTGLSALAIITGTAFWTLLWGPIGLLLAVPLTVILVVLGRYVEPLAFLEVLLGAEPALSLEDRFYHRILSGDVDEAADLAESSVADELNPDAIAAELLMRAMLRAATDAEFLRFGSERGAAVAATFDDVCLLVFEGDEASDQAADNDVTSVAPGQTVLCVGLSRALDQSAAKLLSLRLTAMGRTSVATMMPHLRRTRLSGPTTIFVSAFDVDNRVGQISREVRRLKRSAPEAHIIGCFWDAEIATSERFADRVGVDTVVTTLETASSSLDAIPAPAIIHSKPSRSTDIAAAIDALSTTPPT